MGHFTSVILPTTISPTSPLYLRQRAQPVKHLLLPRTQPSPRPAQMAAFTLPAGPAQAHLVFSALTHTSLFTLSTAPATEAISFSSST